MSNPQVTWYREYLLNPDANAKIQFIDERQAFENALYEKIWHKKLEQNTNYPAEPTEGENAGKGPEPYYTFTYGINDISKTDGTQGCEKSMIFGITFCHARNATISNDVVEYGDYGIVTGYLFIVAAFTSLDTETANDKVIIRTHQLVLVPNTEFFDEPINNSEGATVYHGIRVTGGEIVFGIEIKGNPLVSTFYFPRKSFFLEGRHQDPVPFVDGYKGNFTLII